jgi:coenzyme F420-0:L-glutamate ligase
VGEDTKLIGLKLPLIKPGDDLVARILGAASKVGGLRDGDVLVIASKIVATANGKVKELAEIRPSRRAKQLAEKSAQPPELVEIILREADKILGTSKGAILTIKNGLLCANAGVDRSNVPPGFVALMPSRPNAEAKKLRRTINKRSGRKVGVIISDSNVKPLRVGTVGQAIGIAGIEPVVDYRGQPDLYGRSLRLTFQAVADQLATAAQTMMGEGAERVPAVIVRGTNVRATEKPKLSPKISPGKDLYANLFRIK